MLINDCYNANPMSMRAAIDDLAATAPGRRVAVLGDMLELGGRVARFHREIGAYAAAQGVELLVTVGALARGHGRGVRRTELIMRRGRAGGGRAAGGAAARRATRCS